MSVVLAGTTPKQLSNYNALPCVHHAVCFLCPSCGILPCFDHDFQSQPQTCVVAFPFDLS